MGAISMGGRRAVITGAGRGIGRAYAIDFARRGAAVVVNDVNREAAESVVAEIRAAGGRALATTATVATPAGGAEIIAAAVGAFGGVDIVVNNAGFLRPGYFGELSLEKIDEVLDVHLRGAIFVTQPAWKLMKSQRFGRIVITSSNAALFGHHAAANYAAAKGGLYGLMRELSYEGAPDGICVNAILPMAVTLIGVEQPIPDMMEHRKRLVGEEALAKIAAAPRNPEMVAHMVSYLASDECAVSGEAFSVCCGRYARVFVGLTEGWMSGGAASAEGIRDHLDEIRDMRHYSVPTSLFEEYAIVAQRL